MRTYDYENERGGNNRGPRRDPRCESRGAARTARMADEGPRYRGGAHPAGVSQHGGRAFRYEESERRPSDRRLSGAERRWSNDADPTYVGARDASNNARSYPDGWYRDESSPPMGAWGPTPRSSSYHRPSHEDPRALRGEDFGWRYGTVQGPSERRRAGMSFGYYPEDSVHTGPSEEDAYDALDEHRGLAGGPYGRPEGYDSTRPERRTFAYDERDFYGRGTYAHDVDDPRMHHPRDAEAHGDFWYGHQRHRDWQETNDNIGRYLDGQKRRRSRDTYTPSEQSPPEEESYHYHSHLMQGHIYGSKAGDLIADHHRSQHYDALTRENDAHRDWSELSPWDWLLRVKRQLDRFLDDDSARLENEAFRAEQAKKKQRASK